MLDFKNSKIKSLCQVIIEDFTYYVRDAVKANRTEYLQTGIDNNLIV